MKIEITLDREYPIDPESLDGELIFSDGQNIIKKDFEYIDSWLVAFIRGYLALQTAGNVTVELADEPDEIDFELLSDMIKITHNNTTITEKNLRTFKDSLEICIHQLFSELDNENINWRSNLLLSAIFDFSKGKIDEKFWLESPCVILRQ